MKLLLDSHILLSLARKSLAIDYPRIATRLDDVPGTRHLSVASLWEIAIKMRLGKLALGTSIEAFTDYLEAYGLLMEPVVAKHAIVGLDPEPPTRDPFDRMLLAQCAVENMKLVTVDRALVGHPLTWQGSEVG